ncbi:MAG: hypothetical protein M1816_003905 [Peltula sp. TS41687]|nr:MAG: hypothetical protein M1816_003905 [Peltula sp. TS41687]
MPPPAPPVPLKDHCSVVFNHTLYVYSPDAFQSISLSEGGQWKRLPHGVSVQGATCVKATPDDNEKKAAMFVVGGAANSSSISYPGLQRYIFAEGRWEPVTPVDKVTQNRRNHGAVYLNSSMSILTYAGSQDTADPQASSQTFLISTTPPYSVRSYSSKAPPLVRPLMLQWNQSHAVMVGGDKDNRQVFTFSTAAGWEDLGVTLKNGLPDQSKVQAALVQGDDGSKVLESFDLSTSPNTVTRIVLRRNGRGEGPSPGETFVNGKPSSERRSTQPPPTKRRKRELSLADWPSYNSSLAPKITRSGFSLAETAEGLVVISGGSPEDPLSIFNVRKNQWLNTSDIWKPEATIPSSSAKPTPSPSGTSNSTSPAATSNAALSEPNRGRDKTLVILGATLGTIVGVALLLVAILIWLRWHRKRRRHDEAGQQRRASGHLGEEKDRLSFADRGASFMSQAGGFLGHGQKESVNSSSSMAIMTGQGSRRQKTGPFTSRRASNNRNSLFGRGKGKNPSESPQISRPKMEQGQVPLEPVLTRPAEAAKGPMTLELGRHSSGWSRYFAGESAAHLTTQLDPTHAPDRTPSPSSGAASLPRHLPPRTPEQARTTRSATPTTINFSRSHSFRARGSQDVIAPDAPHSTINTSGTGLAIASEAEPSYLIQGLDESPPSPVSPEDESPPEEAFIFSGGVRASTNEEDTTWSPVGRESEWSSGREPSSVYTDSAHGSMIPREYSASAFPQVPRESTVMVFPRSGAGVSLTNVEDEAAGQSNQYHHQHHSNQEEGGGMDRHHSDMSWLNLGNSRGEEG